MSIQNKVRTLRRSLGLSQKELARRAQTSQLHIQRIEAGQVTRLKLANDVALALNKPLHVAFPALRRLMGKLGSVELAHLLSDEKLRMRFVAAGIDIDPQINSFRFILKNGFGSYVEISGCEKSRLWQTLRVPASIFVVFDGIEERMAINVQKLAFWQFLFDMPERWENADCESSAKSQIKIWIGESIVPLVLDVEPDPIEFGTEEADRDAVLQGLFFDLEHCHESDETFRVDDQDGETAFFRAENIAMLSVPLEAVVPALWESMTEVDSDHDGCC
jgi:transcriptional regulator with XRE-family HTH domain